MYTDLFNKLTASCFNKCSSRKHKEEDLSLGEMSCAGMFKMGDSCLFVSFLLSNFLRFFSSIIFISLFTDRCVSKYLDAQQKIGIVLQQANEAQAQQQQQMMQMQQAMAGK